MTLTAQQRQDIENENALAIRKAAEQQTRKYDLLSMLEPVAQAYQKNWATMETCIDASIAISLKRIADVIEARTDTAQKQPTPTETNVNKQSAEAG